MSVTKTISVTKSICVKETLTVGEVIFLFFVLLNVRPCIISQISPTRCTILLNIFISLLYTFRASMCPSSGENYCICATLVFVTLYGWHLVCWLD